MKVLIRSNPGTDQFPELQGVPTVGDVIDVSNDIGEKLIAVGCASKVEEIKGVPPKKPKNDE